MRLINADALIEILTTAIRNMKVVAKFIGAEDDPELKMEIKAYTDILNGVKEQPTIELEVIRCKDCKHRNDYAYWLGCPILNTDDDNYCSYAERRTE